VIAHRGVALIGLALIAWAVPRIAIWTGVRPALASAVAIASPLMMANGVGGLHNDLLMVGLMAAALAVGIERGWVWGSLVGGLAAAVKLPGGLVCIPIVLAALPAGAGLMERVKRLAASAVVALSALVGLGAVWGLGVGWVKALSVPATVNTPLSAPTVVGGILDWSSHQMGLGLAPATFVDLIRTIATGASVVLIGCVALRWPTGDRLRAVEATVVLIGGLLLLSPVVHLWYLLWVVPFAATLRLQRGLTLLMLAVAVVAGLVAPLDSSLHDAYLLIVMGSMYVALAVPLLLLTRRGRERMRHIAEADWLPVP
jgi:hypothetical protein